MSTKSSGGFAEVAPASRGALRGVNPRRARESATDSYGVGITAEAVAEGLIVVEVIRPERAEQRRLGKSDPIDAYQAARAALGNHRVAPVKNNAAIEGIRALHSARRSAMKARTAAMRQIHAQLITAPSVIREKYREKRLIVLARMQVPANRTPVERSVLLVLKTLAQRAHELQREHERLGAQLDQLVTVANPGLRAAHGVGPDTAAQLLLTAGGNSDRLRSEAAFAALCGVSPIPASSGKTVRHRLSRGGDRAANGALYRIALVRMSSDARTKEYVARQRDAGFSNKEILRKLKRALAREVFRLLTTSVTVPGVDDLRPLRQAKHITLTAAANQLGVGPPRSANWSGVSAATTALRRRIATGSRPRRGLPHRGPEAIRKCGRCQARAQVISSRVARDRLVPDDEISPGA